MSDELEWYAPKELPGRWYQDVYCTKCVGKMRGEQKAKIRKTHKLVQVANVCCAKCAEAHPDHFIHYEPKEVSA